jgi:hypothetical protein
MSCSGNRLGTDRPRPLVHQDGLLVPTITQEPVPYLPNFIDEFLHSRLLNWLVQGHRTEFVRRHPLFVLDF